MKLVYSVDGYLTESKLSHLLQSIVPAEDWIGTDIKVPGTRCRYDMSFKRKEKIYVVEFDGDSHYRDGYVMQRDIMKDDIAGNLGWTVIRIPYWVQLTAETFEYYFGFKVDMTQTYPHGFISKNVVLPISFCYPGFRKFEEQLDLLPSRARRDVMFSLLIKGPDMKWIVPDFFNFQRRMSAYRGPWNDSTLAEEWMKESLYDFSDQIITLPLTSAHPL